MPGEFPPTRASVVAALTAGDATARERARARVVETYWRPVYKYLRLRWRIPREEAEDLTQGYFAAALERGLLERYDPSRARFRTWLRLGVDGHAANERKAARRLKRGGDSPHVSLDFDAAESEVLRAGPGADDPEELFRREWIRSLLGLAVEDLQRRLESEGKTLAWRIFERYDLQGAAPGERLTYADLAVAEGVPVTKVTNDLHLARRLFREVVLARLAELCATPEELRDEARDLLGTDPS
jgi:RNA polymerase sigma factor (sigma-70 family)